MRYSKCELLIYSTMALLSCLTSCKRIGGNGEELYDDYDTFKKHEGNLAKYLPESSTQIRYFAVLDFDTNYHFVEATVQIEHLKEFATSKNNFDSQFNCSDVPYSDQKFDQLFYKRPIWWNQKSLVGYKENHLCLFADTNNYGGGCWIFYDNKAQKVRVFTWSQQWLSLEDVKKGLHSDP